MEYGRTHGWRSGSPQGHAIASLTQAHPSRFTPASCAVAAVHSLLHRATPSTDAGRFATAEVGLQVALIEAAKPAIPFSHRSRLVLVLARQQRSSLLVITHRQPCPRQSPRSGKSAASVRCDATILGAQRQGHLPAYRNHASLQPAEQLWQSEARGPALRCVHTKQSQKAGPFSVARLKMDLPFHNRLAFTGGVPALLSRPAGVEKHRTEGGDPEPDEAANATERNLREKTSNLL